MVSTRYWSFPPNAQGEGEDVLQSPLCLPLGVSVFGLCRSHAEVAACPSDRSCDSGPLACPSRRLAVFFSFFFFSHLGLDAPVADVPRRGVTASLILRALLRELGLVGGTNQNHDYTDIISPVIVLGPGRPISRSPFVGEIPPI